nr:MAG TPA: RNA polymerase II subunit [Caudoviricetes sp.]
MTPEQQKAEVYDMLREDYELDGGLVDFVDWQAKRIKELEAENARLRQQRDAANAQLDFILENLKEELPRRSGVFS